MARLTPVSDIIVDIDGKAYRQSDLLKGIKQPVRSKGNIHPKSAILVDEQGRKHNLVELLHRVGSSEGAGGVGADGREIELKKVGNSICWKYVDEIDWIELVSLDELKGEKGDKGDSGECIKPPVATRDCATVVIIDDDGTTRILDNYTGMLSWLNNKNIPLSLACITTTIGTSGKLTLEQLHNLEAQGNEVVCHSSVEDKSNTMTEENYKNILGSAKQWMIDNGFTKGKDIFVYPQGLNSDGVSTVARVKEMVGEYFKYGLNVNISSSTEDYDIDTKGVWNKVPLADRLNISRMEINSTKGLTNHKKAIDNCIAEKGLLILFTHSFQSQFSNGGFDNLKEVVNYLEENNCKFLTSSEALKEVEGLSGVNLAEDVEKIKDEILTLKTNSHTHSNIEILNGFADSNGSVSYKGKELATTNIEITDKEISDMIELSWR